MRRCSACRPRCGSASPPCRPLHYLRDIRAPLIVLLHDRDDPVIPVGESRRLRDALAGAQRGALHRVHRVPAPGPDEGQTRRRLPWHASSSASRAPSIPCSVSRPRQAACWTRIPRKVGCLPFPPGRRDWAPVFATQTEAGAPARWRRRSDGLQAGGRHLEPAERSALCGGRICSSALAWGDRLGCPSRPRFRRLGPVSAL